MRSVLVIVALMAGAAWGQTTRPTTRPADYKSALGIVKAIPSGLILPNHKDENGILVTRRQKWVEENIPGKTVRFEMTMGAHRRATAVSFEYSGKMHICCDAQFEITEKIADILVGFNNDRRRVVVSGTIKTCAVYRSSSDPDNYVQVKSGESVMRVLMDLKNVEVTPK